ncbi:TetR/AcrR family transcriptional regulator [Corynebacterium cystitidis]|uniref:TetR/AcrR family transcriptional regulator n=1 Tax=Corynebacterium cystitidis TaxID=35757 RepID=UPI00211E976E|nr:TetR/AcrR family transcriptional regulator [Corynebacterium cystitidis]
MSPTPQPQDSRAADPSASDAPKHDTSIDMADTGDIATVDDVIDIALAGFAQKGFNDTTIDSIAKKSGMSKRMIHYHFGDKKGLYQQALAEAVARLHPPEEVLNRSYAVPVEGVRRFVDALFYRMVEQEDAQRLIQRENMDPVLKLTEISAIADASELTLHLERLLMMGQDAGAFRPGISADDVLALIVALGSFRLGYHALSVNLFNIDTASQENTDGMRRFVIDAVLAFLTSNIPDSGYDAYLTASPALPDVPVDGEIYELGDDIY